jgi:hypothetical protein
VSGATGDNALISLASATSDPSSSKTLGLTAEAIANDAFGYVIEAGYLTDIDTSATTAGAAVWLGDTAGSLSFVNPPAKPSHAVYLGVVVRVQAINGSILVKVQNGYELDELHDVFVGGVSTALPLVYNSTSSGWVAQALTSVGIADNAIVAAKINAGAVGSAALADNAVVAAKIAAAAVGTVAISSGSATNGQILQANGSGGVSFSTLPSSGSYFIKASSGEFLGSSITATAGAYALVNYAENPIVIETTSTTSVLATYDASYISALSDLSRVAASGGIEWTSGTSGFSTSTIYELTYGGGLYVSAGGATTGLSPILQTSPDGITWTTRTTGFTGYILCLGFGSSLYVAGGGTALRTSSDAITWTARTPNIGSGNVPFDVIFAGGQFVLVGENGGLSTSTDGTTWTGRTTSWGGGQIFGVTYGNSLYVIAGTAGKMKTSSDGISWASVTSGFSSALAIQGVTYANGLFVAVGGGGNISTSTDGTTWTIRTSGTTQTLNRVSYGEGVFIAVGDNGVLITSYNGITWTSRSAQFGTTNIRAVTFGDSLYVIGGDSGKISTSSTSVNIDIMLLPTTLQSI